MIVSFALVSQVLAATVTYTYDDLNRLIQESYSNGTVINYSYDSAGNRVSKEVLSAAGAITLITPNGGEHWRAGSTETLYWTYKGTAGTMVKIELYKGSVLNSTIVAGTSIGSNGSGSFDWVIPAGQAPGADYKIKISSTGNGTITDLSGSAFTIESAPVFSVMAPTSGAFWQRGSTQTITWTYTGDAGSSVRLDLMKGGQLHSNIAQSAPIGSDGSGSFSWSIPAEQAPAGDYQIRIATPAGEHESTSGVFTTGGGITISHPYSGQSWPAGSYQTISWSCDGDPGPLVKIELLKGGMPDSTITVGAPVGSSGSGSYSWRIPTGQAAGTDYAIRITSTSNNAWSGVSKESFTIVRPTITVANPYSGNSWPAGSLQTIHWDYSGDPGSMVKVELLKGGVLDTVLTPVMSIGDGDEGYYYWSIPVTQAAGTDYAIRITSTTDSAISGTSATFTIVAPAITVDYPYSGANWEAGELQTISWSYKGDPGSMVKIDLLKGGVLSNTIAASTPIGSGGSGSYLWLIPVGQTSATDYAIRITSTSNSAYTAVSNNSFTIVAPGIAVNYPSSNASWAAGSLQTIGWNYKGDPGSAVKIELLKGGAPNTTITPSTPIGSGGSGSYQWLIPANQTAGTDYSVRITSTSNNAYSGVSNSSFTIVTPSIMVSSPNGGNSWETGSTQTISWNYAGDPGSMVKIDLLKGGTLNTTLADSAPVGSGGSGSFAWIIPAGQAPGTDYTVRVTSTSNNSYGDTSNSNFTIKVADAIVVTAPNGGESWQAGTAKTIAWKYSGNAGSTVTIELFKGSSVNATIASNVSIGSGGSGSYSWTVPASQTPGTDYWIRVKSSQVSGSSNQYFAITNASVITVASPNGGETFQAGTTQTIRWTYAGNPGSTVTIELLKSGTVSATLANGTSIGTGGNGSYSWTIPAGQTESSYYQIRVTCGSLSDTSNDYFRILPSLISVSSPYSGTTWEAGNLQTIEWYYYGNPGTAVRIELLKGGMLNTTIVAGTPIGKNGSGSYKWLIPVGQAVGTDYSIRVTSTSGSQYAGTSKNTFTIVAPSITVTTPNGGNSWPAGSLQRIYWNFDGDPGSMVKIDLLKGGVLDTAITAGTPIGTNGSGSYDWLIPKGQAARTDYSIRITSTGNGTYTDVSNSSFTVTAPSVAVTAPNGGNSWAAGSLQTIKWNYRGDPGSMVRIDLLKGGVLQTTIAASTPIGDYYGEGSYKWLIPVGQAAGSDYTVRITSTGNSACTDVSDSSFTIVAPNITVNHPYSGNNWEAGLIYTITWNYEGNPGSMVKIDLLKGGVLNTTITSSTPLGNGNGSGFYYWLIPAGQPSGTDYSIRVTSTSNSAYSDVSSNHFSILAPSLTVSSPNGGNSWVAGSLQTIGWNWRGDPGSMVKIDLLKGGIFNATITPGTPVRDSNGWGSYSWLIPVGQAASADYTIRLTSTSNSAYTDVSDSSFTIVPPSITLSSPNGGDSRQAGTTETIRWSYKGNPGSNVKIDLLKGGVLNATIASGTAIGSGGSGSYTWEIPDGQEVGSDYTIRVTSTSNSAYTDVSNSNFSIVASGIILVSPNGGERWQAGTTQTISWTYNAGAGSAVKIYLWGASNSIIASSVPIGSNGSGSFQWAIPLEQEAGTNCSIQVTSTSNSSYTDVSRNQFTILPAQETGSFTGIIAPQAAITAGAQWKMDGGSWKNSGQTLSAVTVGSHTVTFKSISGWTTPAAQTITVSEGKTATATGTYTQEFGSLTVTITPPAAVTAGAQWKLDAGAWQPGGTTLQNVPGGSHTVTFKDVAGWITPASQPVTIANGQPASVSGNYSEQPPGGALTVAITPATAVSAGAQWKVDTGAWQASGATVAGLSAGLHTVTFKDLTNWTTPATQSVTVTNGQTAAASGAYQSKVGSLTVAISPQEAVDQGAQWQLDGGAWRAGGATVANLSITQTHTLTFKEVQGWTTPAVQVLNVPAEGLSVTGTYVQQSPVYSISGTVTNGEAGLSGVSVNLSGAAAKSATTDSNGNYSFSGLANGSYTVTPGKTGYSFAPVSLSVTVNGADVVGRDFVATPPSYSISGMVTSGGAGLSGVAVNLSGAATKSTTTDVSGNYSFSGLLSGSYTITPSKSNHAFTPMNRSVTVSGMDVAGQNFTAGSGYSISGTVTCGGTALPGVTVNLAGATTKSTTTDSNGSYSFTGLANGSYTITPSKTEHTFSPVNRSVTIAGGNVAAKKFTAKTKPGEPTGVTAKAGNARARVKFTAPVSNGGSAITSYTVESTPGGITKSGSASPIIVTGLTNGTTYTFTVKATSKIGSGPKSAESNPVTPAAKPGKPTGVAAAAGNAEATVSFTAPASDGGSPITSYQVISSPGKRTVNGKASPIKVAGLINGKTYTFTVVAINAMGSGPKSAESNPVRPATVPGKPTGVKATAGNARAKVSFTAPASNGGSAITFYTVTTSPGNITKDGNASPITVPDLTNGTSYTFTVTATNKMGTGDPSLPSNPVTPAAVSVAPTGVEATGGRPGQR